MKPDPTCKDIFAVDSLHVERWRGRRFRSTDRLAPVLPIVLYTGRSPWSAAPRVIDLVTPGATGAWGGDGDLASRVNPLFTGERYLVVDTFTYQWEYDHKLSDFRLISTLMSSDYHDYQLPH